MHMRRGPVLTLIKYLSHSTTSHRTLPFYDLRIDSLDDLEISNHNKRCDDLH